MTLATTKENKNKYPSYKFSLVMSILAPFQLLELNVISAQDLQPVCSRKMRSYAVAWIRSEQKLSTRIDTQGQTNPTWNEKFYFRVDDEFLRGDTSTLTIEIYAVHWFRDIHVGTVQVMIENLIPTIFQTRNCQKLELGTKLVSFQIWRQSGRSQGILNIGVALLDNTMRSMPLYRHLMGKEDIFQSSNNNQFLLNGLIIKPDLRRTKSDSSSSLGFDLTPRRPMKGSSIVNGGPIVNSRGSSIVNYVFDKSTEIKRKTPPGKSPPSGSIFIGSDYGDSRKVGAQKIWTDSELGPSPSEVAAAVAKSKNRNKIEAGESSVGKEGSSDGSIEGLRSKLERWRTEIPPVYDRSDGISSFLYDETTKTGTKRLRRRRRNKKGLFSCFGNICGCQISVNYG